MKIRALILFFFGFVLLAPAQVGTFKILYGGGQQDEARFVEPLPDGSFLVAGQTGPNALLVRFNADGTEQWSRTFGGPGTDLFTRLLACSDGNFIALGETTSIGAGNVDFLVVKFDPAGNVIWQRTAGGSNEETARGICEVADGYVISGGTRSFGAGFWDIFVEKIDFNGNTLWTRAWGGGGGDIGGEVLPAPNNEIWVSGFVFVVTNNHDANLFRLSSGGDLLAATRYTLPDNDGFGSINAGGPGFFAAGGTWFNNTHYPMLMGFTAAGTLSWARRYVVPGGNFEGHIESTPDGGGIFAAHNISNDTQNAILVRLSSTGDVIWARAHSFEGSGRIRHMRATADGGFVAVGYDQSGSRQLFIVKTDADGLVELCCPNDVTIPVVNLNPGTVSISPAQANGPANLTASMTNTAAGFPVIDICDGPCCTPPDVLIAPPPGITCLNSSVTLDATTSSQGPNFSLQWSGPGIVSGQNSPQPVVNQAGTYTLTITNTLTGCSEEASVQVPDLTQNPTAVATAPTAITCALTSASISGAGSSTGPNFSYQWSTNDGNILSGATQINATVNQPGTYLLTVTNQATGCVSTATVVVVENTTPPAAVAGPALQLGCNSPQGQLNGTGSATGAGILYSWSPNPASGGNTLTPTVNQPGTYTLTVLNTTNGCSASSQTSVTANFNLPVVLIAEPPSVSCLSTEVQLDATASSSGPDYTYTWTTTNGLLLSGASTPTPTVGAAGTYLLQITNQANGCVAGAAIQVTGSNELPSISIAPAEEITCGQPSIQLEGIANPPAEHLVFSWTADPGNIVSGAQTLNPTVNAGGTYLLLATDTLSGCSDTASVLVLQNGDIPIISLPEPEGLNCLLSTTLLDAGASTLYPGVSIAWQTVNGNILSGAESLEILVDAPGTYILTLQDTLTQCTATQSVQVDIDTLTPALSMGPAGLLNCVDTTLTLTAVIDLQGSSTTLQWSTLDGQIISAIDQQEIMVSAGGWYVLEVLNTENGCAAQDSVLVELDQQVPLADAGPSVELNCGELEITLSGSGSQGPEFEYSWSGPGLLSGAQSLSPLVNAPGSYILTVLNQQNGCSATAETEVVSNEALPQIVLSAPAPITCTQPQVELDATGSSSEPFIEYQWSSADGQILSGANSPLAQVNAPGTYTLSLQNTLNQCTVTQSVLVDIDTVAPNPGIASSGIITCLQPEQQLLADPGMLGDFSFSWQTADGNFASGAQTLSPWVDQPGTYVLEVINQQNGCPAMVQLTLDADILAPALDIGPAALLTCADTTVSLVAVFDTPGSSATLQWSTISGQINGPADQQEIFVSAAGWYVLEVLNTENGCTAQDSVLVELDQQAPVAEAGAGGTLNCLNASVTLDASASSTGAELVYFWSGGPLQGDSTLTPIATQAGVYQLTVLNTLNQCIGTDSVEVLEDFENPIADAGPLAELSCAEPEIILDGSGSQGAEFEYTWSGPGLLSGAQSLSPLVNAPGIYTLTVQNLLNGCTTTAQTEVVDNGVIPQASIVPPAVLTCLQTDVTLVADGSSSGSNIEYLWTSPDGQILSGANSPQALVSAAGIYFLLVSDVSNGCNAQDSVVVVQDTQAPEVSIMPPLVLSCTLNSLQLDASASSQEPGMEYLWTSANGNLLSGANTLTPVVNQPGSYLLQITNAANGCSAVQEVVVEQDIEPPLVDAGIGFTWPCDQAGVYLSGSVSNAGPSPQLSWQSANGTLLAASNTLTPEIGAGGVYILTVLNTDNGCEASDQVEVLEAYPDLPAWSLQQPACPGDFGALQLGMPEGGTPPYVYSLDGGMSYQPSPEFGALAPGVYTLVVQDALGCEQEETVYVWESPGLVLGLEATVAVQLGDSVQLLPQLNVPETEIAQVLWSPALGLSCVDCLRPWASPPGSTVYHLELTTVSGCRAEARVQVFVDINTQVYVPNVFSPNDDGFNDVFTLFAREGSIREVRSLRVFSRWGETVFERTRFQPNDLTQGWDGRHRGQLLNPAVFVWLAEVEFPDGRVEVLKGDVSLVR